MGGLLSALYSVGLILSSGSSFWLRMIATLNYFYYKSGNLLGISKDPVLLGLKLWTDNVNTPWELALIVLFFFLMYINTYMWNLGKRYWWTYLQGRNRDSGIENRLTDTAGTEEAQPGALWQARGVGCGGKEVQEGGRMCTCGWFMLMCGRNQHNTAKELSSPWK